MLKELLEWLDFNQQNDIVKRNALTTYNLMQDDEANYAVIAKSGKIVFQNKTKEDALKLIKAPLLVQKYGQLQIKRM